MAKKKKGAFMDRLLLGKEKSEGYARASLPSNRWELFWDIVKGSFGKLFVINLLVLLFSLPLFALLLIRTLSIVGFGSTYPFSQAFGTGFLAPDSLVGYSQQIVVNVDLYLYLLFPLAMAIFAVGLSGGAYVVRNMVWTEGIFVVNDFWTGIKRNIKQILLVCLVYSVIFYVNQLSIALIDEMIVLSIGIEWLFVFSKVILYITFFFVTMMAMHMITMSVTYNLKFFALVKNAFLLTVAFIPTNVFFGFLCIVPFLLFSLGSFFQAVSIILVIILGFSFPLLIWTDYSQWIYDKYINDKVPGAKKNRGIYEKVKESDAAAIKLYKEQVNILTASSLSSRPIKPITDDELKLTELPDSFSRADLEKLNESKKAIYEDNEKYIEEHKNDPEFEAYKNAKSEQGNEEKEKQKRIEKAKKELSKRK